MQRLTTVAAWRAYCDAQRQRGRRVGLVPTMGALHQGHASLFRAAKDHGDVVVATLFVNPRQFNDDADLRAYPQTPERDRELAEASGVDCLVEPTLREMWPDAPGPTPTVVAVRGLSDSLEGDDRPGHFDGVASVVAKLFAVTGPCRAYFGEKDYQQLAVVRQMVCDLSFDVEVIGSAIVRDADGLAVSSRNVHLTPSGRDRALALSRAVRAAAATPAPASVLRALTRDVLDRGDLDVAYAEVVDPVTLVPSADDESGAARVLVAAVVDGVRLIDNASVTLTKGER